LESATEKSEHNSASNKSEHGNALPNSQQLSQHPAEEPKTSTVTIQPVTFSAIRKWAEFYVQQHNQVMPHHAFKGPTPNEMFFGTGKTIEAELKQARADARRTRIEANRQRSCAACSMSQAELHQVELNKP
jgi:hypothetical protein